MTDDASTPSRGRWPAYFDAIAAIAMTIASGVVIWTLLAPSPTAAVPMLPADASSRIPTKPISIDGAPIKGRPDAPIAIVEFSEFQCPFCANFANDTLPSLLRSYVDTGKVFFVFQHLPLESIHPLAFDAAVATECASDQGRFWQMHDALFRIQKDLKPASFAEQAKRVGLDEREYTECSEQATARNRVRVSLSRAKELGVTATPTFFIGLRQPDGRIRVIRRVSGAQPFSAFEQALKSIQELP